MLEIRGRVSFILFKNFFEANTAREFLQNGQNFKESEKNNFGVRWMVSDDMNNLSEDFRKRLSKFNLKFFDPKKNSGSLNGMNNQTVNNIPQMNMMIGHNNMMGNLNINSNMMNQTFINNGNNMGPNNYYQMMNQNSYMGGTINNMNNMQNLQNPNNNLQNLQNNPNLSQTNCNQNLPKLQNNKTPQNNRKSSQSIDEKDDKKLAGLQGQNGKYTCRFEILIENDKDFQVARRLIGAKVKYQIYYTRGVT